MPPRSVLTLGNFDGVHLGHRAILQRCQQLAQTPPHPTRPPTRVVAITFDRPPIAILRPGSEPPQIDCCENREALLKNSGADHVDWLTVTPALLDQSAEIFIAKLVERFAPCAIVEGPDFRFGKQRKGDAALLRTLGKQHDFTVEIMPRVSAVLSDRQVVPVNSSLVRWLVGRGRVADAQRCLGRPFVLTATIVQGEQRGRTLGFPTANLSPDDLQGRILPADGVYAARAQLQDGRTFPAAVSIGLKPTFGGHALTVEAHLPGFSGDLYGSRLSLHFARWLRDQSPFPGVESLKSQLHRDVAATQQACADATALSSTVSTP